MQHREINNLSDFENVKFDRHQGRRIFIIMRKTKRSDDNELGIETRDIRIKLTIPMTSRTAQSTISKKGLLTLRPLVFLIFLTVAALLLPASLTKAATQVVQISDTNDDAYEYDNGIFLGSEYVAVRSHSTPTFKRHGGFRFPGITVPQGATINAATFEGYVYTSANDDMYATVYGNAIDDAPNFFDAQDIDGRGRTTANIPMSHPSWGVGWKSVDVTAIVQEIVDRTGWSCGNALAILFIGADSPSGYYCYFDDIAGALHDAAKLTIDYTITNPPPPSEDPLIAYAPASGGPQYSIWDGSTWPDGASGPTMGTSIQWVVTKANPTRNEVIMGGYQYHNSAPHAYVSIYGCGEWDDGTGSPTGDSKDLGVLPDYQKRGFDIAYEANSGRALVVGSTGTSLNYWIWNGSSWENSGNPYTYSPAGGSGNILWVKLASKPYSNEIAMITADSDGDVYGNIWDGDTDQWLSAKKQLLEDQASYTTGECVAVEYIRTGTNAGKAMFVWGAGTGGVELQSRTWDGGSSASNSSK